MDEGRRQEDEGAGCSRPMLLLLSSIFLLNIYREENRRHTTAHTRENTIQIGKAAFVLEVFSSPFLLLGVGRLSFGKTVEKLKITGWTEHSLPFLSQDQIFSSYLLGLPPFSCFFFLSHFTWHACKTTWLAYRCCRRFRKAENIFWKIFSICYNIFLFLPISLLLLAAEELIGFFLLSLWPIAVPFFWGFFFGSVGSHGPGLDGSFSLSLSLILHLLLLPLQMSRPLISPINKKKPQGAFIANCLPYLAKRPRTLLSLCSHCF
jgi:hypothetical protein